MRPIRSARDLGALVRGRRTSLGLSQAALAASAGVSRQWLSEIEAGKATAEFGRVLLVLDALRLDLTPQPRENTPTARRAARRDLDEVLREYRSR